MNILIVAIISVLAIYLFNRLFQQLGLMWKSIMNIDYSSYPAFKKYEIAYIENHAKEKYEEVNAILEAVNQLEKNEKKDTKRLNDFSQNYKDKVRDLIYEQLRFEMKTKEYQFMIEGNFKVINGSKTINEVKSEYSKRFSGMFIKRAEFEKRYKEWMNTKF